MTDFEELLEQHREGITRRWFDAAVAAYPADGAAAFARQEDPFANPVGHSLREGTRGVFRALLEGSEPAAVSRYLHEVIRIRAVQDFSASEALGCIFELKGAVREELADLARDPGLAADLMRLERQIDQVALAAFDVFVECRERVSELRVNEMKRQVSWIVDKLNAGGADPESVPIEGE